MGRSRSSIGKVVNLNFKTIGKGTLFDDYRLKTTLKLIWEDDIDEKGRFVKGCYTEPELIEVFYYNYSHDKKGTPKHRTEERLEGWGETKSEALEELKYLIGETLYRDGTDPQIKGFDDKTKDLFEKVENL